FLDQAAQELAQDGKVIPVRLAVFAEMVKGREWTPATLKSLGGMEGVGVTFLEEAFSSAAAPPAHRVHQVAARAVLKALLPEQGTDIRGNLRPYQELLEASGYAGRPRDFEELLRILDRELRLVSPSTPEGTDSESGRRAPSPEGQFYQLTHDYLVPALRAWLTRKQKETRRGRAEIRLAERAALWSHKPENRHLPSWWEWARIRLLTRPRDWTEPQRAMMRRAAGLHAVRGLALAIVVVLAVWGGWHYVSRLKEQALVDGLRSAGPAEMAAILKEIGRHPRRLEGPLRAAYAEAEAKGDTEGKLRLSLALLPSDPSQAEYLYTRLFDVQPQEFITVRDTLAPYKEEYIAQLWAELDNRAADPERPKRRFRAACALARYAPNDQRWAKYGPFVVQWLVAENALVLSYWNEALQPVGPELLDALAGALEDNHWGLDERRTLTELYRGFAAGTEDGFMPLEKRLADGATVGGSGAKHVALARRKANVAAALVALGRGEAAWPLLIHSDDPTVRSCLIERLSSAGVDPRILVERLDKESNLSARRALVLALGGFSQDQVPLVEPVLLKLCENAIDPGLHAAAGWLLRRWGHDEQLQQIDQRLATGKLEGGRRWYVNKQGQTFTIIRSSPSARGGGPAHPQISQMAPVFAIASTEVTVVQFRAFKVDHQPDRDVAPTDVCPVNLVSWYDAAAYCNWLSEQARIPKSQWCYQKNKAGMLESASDYMLRIGYRLPTEAEWEFACRAGARTGWYFGEADAELAGKYAWWYGNSQADGNPRAYPVGSLKPNDWGLFDMHGNLSEWCQDPMTRSGSVGGAKDRPGGFWNDVNCRVRGGSYRAPFVDIGCASWALSGRKMRLPALGFRPVQTRR
ncbi:MAG TPA: formylglycine-generating enzyme family protein, partial [Gemmataceae bacterium]|nr:formylglycine-generating enzyme family protein [Gemmataceae bacterium]